LMQVVLPIRDGVSLVRKRWPANATKHEGIVWCTWFSL
jgi:predicted alpha/beta hydrolase